MQIRDVKVYIHQEGARQWEYSTRGQGAIESVPPGHSGLMTHTLGFRAQRPEEVVAFRDPAPRPWYKATLRLVTDGGLDAHTEFGTGYHVDELQHQAQQFRALIAPMLIGVDAFDREYVYQRMWYAQRFFYTGRRNVDMLDNMLWDLAARHARLPLYKLLGGYRESIPAYRNIGGSTLDELVADGIRAKAEGFRGCKDHSYRGVKGNAEMARALRQALGDDFILLHDPVEHYTCDEAIKIGRVLEKYGYTWMEEPLQDFDFMGLKKLSAALDLQILAMEWIGYLAGQPYSAAQFLAQQAIDIVRQRAVGITGQIKLAQLAETFGVAVHGGDPHVILAIGNDPLFEAWMGLQKRPPEEELDCRGRLVVEDGSMSIAWADRPVREPDWDQLARDAVAII
jgi:L-alanine-DL-glutamate epimerase-like enolase superfamily enzyme